MERAHETKRNVRIPVEGRHSLLDLGQVPYTNKKMKLFPTVYRSGARAKLTGSM